MTCALNSLVRHLHRLKSDHRPFLVSITSTVSSKVNCPFQFLASWLFHLEFGSLVRDNWKSMDDLTVNIHEFIESAKEWNNKVFGNIFARKRRFMEELRKVQIALENQNCQRLRDHKIELRTTIEDTLQQ